MNKRRFLIQLILLGVIIAGRAGVAAEGDPRAVVSPPSWDFGYLPQKSEVSHTFYLKNIDAKPLTVKKIDAGCSCASVSKLEEPIPPGDSAAITVTFKSGRYHHGVKKTSTIFTENSQEPEYKLRILAHVFRIGEETRGVQVAPPQLTWDVKDSTIAVSEDTLRITNLRPLAAQLAVLQIPDDLVDYDLPQDSVPPRQEAKLVLRLKNQAIKKKISGASITMALIHGDTTIFTVPLKIKM